MTVAERLKFALRKQERTIDSLLQGVKKAKVRGASRARVYAYLAGAEPTPTFLRAAARELGVREAWLFTGEGQMTEPEQGLRASQELAVMEGLTARGRRWQEATGAILEAVPALERASPVVRTMFAEAVFRSVGGSRGGWATKAELGERATAVWSRLLDPLTQPGFDPTLDPRRSRGFDADRFTDYAVAMLHALTLAMRTRP